MRVALLICTYNRPEYLKQCLNSVAKADLSGVNELMIVDDKSFDPETLRLAKEFNFKNSHLNLLIKTTTRGIKHSLLIGYERLFQTNEIVINLDSDAVVKPDFVSKLVILYKAGLDGQILTGFHSETINANGTDRHLVTFQNEYYYKKKSVGGINFCIDKEAYEKYVKHALIMPGNWDFNACVLANGAYCLRESVVQHIGFDSSMNHNELPDTAQDFYMIEIPEVTLIGVDSNPHRLEIAKLKCTSMIKFGNVVTLNPNITSKEQYSEFAIKELYKHVNTSHALIFQHDGFVNNWEAWDNDWLKYDYIGAPWAYQDGMAVGNGGFSLRSKKLMEAVATDPQIKILHPEDHHICRTYRPYLEKKYGIKFAPIEVAEKFAFEGYMQPLKVLSNQFGVHGSNPRKVPAHPIRTTHYVFNQPHYLGDILFLVPMCRALMEEGNSILWPISKKFFSIAKHFPDINFVVKEDYDLPYDIDGRINTKYGEMLPYRFTDRFGMRVCMRMKYERYGHDYLMWRNLTWIRDYKKESELISLLQIKGEYQLVNRLYGNNGNKIEPDINPLYPIIEMQPIDGFSLLDWCGVIEDSKEIHTASTSILYVLEIMELKMPIHFYKRRVNGEVAYEHTDYLFTKPYILH